MPSYIPGSPSHWTGDMTETITVYKKQASRDNYGKASISGTATTYSARVQADVSRTRDSEGVEVVEGGYAYVLNDANIEVGDRLVCRQHQSPVDSVPLVPFAEMMLGRHKALDSGSIPEPVRRARQFRLDRVECGCCFVGRVV